MGITHKNLYSRTGNNMTQETEQKSNLTEISRWLKVLCEPNRLMLLDAIISGVQCNCELGETLGLAPNLISHHLSIMRETGLIVAERDQTDARWIYYTVDQEVLESLQHLLSSFLDPARIQPLSYSCRQKQT
jgi:ArsR family transcriptional regulator